MEYTISRLSNIAGITTRTLRYYDEIEILKPARINSSGYRVYGQKQVDRLQQILFYRELGLGLEEIKNIINSPTYDNVSALREHRKMLLSKRNRLDILIENVDKTIASTEGRITMSDKEKFEGFKKSEIDKNEKKYGKEIREKYGDNTVDESNKKLLNMTEAQYEESQRLSQEILDTLTDAMESGDPNSDIAQRTAELHKQWLKLYWPKYSKEAHAGLANMYVEDERFTAYYDEQIKTGAAEFLRDAILVYTSK